MPDESLHVACSAKAHWYYNSKAYFKGSGGWITVKSQHQTLFKWLFKALTAFDVQFLTLFYLNKKNLYSTIPWVKLQDTLCEMYTFENKMWPGVWLFPMGSSESQRLFITKMMNSRIVTTLTKVQYMYKYSVVCILCTGCRHTNDKPITLYMYNACDFIQRQLPPLSCSMLLVITLVPLEFKALE